jgi:hypothetical protein
MVLFFVGFIFMGKYVWFSNNGPFAVAIPFPSRILNGCEARSFVCTRVIKKNNF